MAVENVMYFALGVLAAGLLALMIMPAIWKRAVRLTKKRIEAATPMSMAEFRADKDQLRAEFALSTRRLETTAETLRQRLAEQLGEINRRRNDLAAVKGDRDNQLTIISELEEREGELRRRVLELEKEGAELSMRLRMRDREYADKVTQLESAREAVRAAEDLNRLAQFDTSAGHPPEPGLTIEGLSRPLPAADGAEARESADLLNAEASIDILLAATAEVVAIDDARGDRLLAEKLSLDDEVARLRARVESVEAAVMADGDSDRLDQVELRAQLDGIASDVSRIVYAEERNRVDSEESLFDRVQRFADDGLKLDEFPVRTALEAKQAAPRPGRNGSGVIADRLSALRDLQGRN